MSTEHVITVVAEADLEELLPLLRGYCDFYEVDPSDDALLAVSRALIADPEREGLQLIARDADGKRGRLRDGLLDLADAQRGAPRRHERPVRRARGARHGLADRLIAACRERAADHGAAELAWQTAKDNHRAQAVYDRIGGSRSDHWLDYSLPTR